MSFYYFTVLTPQKPCFLILLSQSWSVSNGAKQLTSNNLTGDKSQQKFFCATSAGRDSHSFYQNRSAKQQHKLQNVSCQLYRKNQTNQQQKTPFIVEHCYLNHSLECYMLAVQQIKDSKKKAKIIDTHNTFL